ncbi:MAG TPA: hypothetical protein O0X42_02400 [Methanocorpusculum sp.]|nr:hypothetical protein [Methanocorpusculum sp.]
MNNQKYCYPRPNRSTAPDAGHPFAKQKKPQPKAAEEESMLKWISQKFTHYVPTRSIAVRALRHMRPADRKNLFSEDIMLMRTAEGYWFEYLIYEQLIRITEETDTIKSIVRKGADVKSHKVKNQLGTNGIYSADKGDIRVRGNGQDLAEVDLLIFDKNDRVVFCEIVTSPADLKDLEAEIIYKKKLFGYLFGQDHVGFILFTSVDIANTQTVKRLKSDPDNAYICTASCETMKRCLSGLRLMNLPTNVETSPKLVKAEDLHTVQFDYKKLHDEALSQLYFAQEHHLTANQFFDNPSVSPLVKKVICGGLYPSAVKSLIANHGLRIKSEVLTPEKVFDEYSKVIVAVDFPEIEPVVYLRPRKKREYLKLVPSSLGGFKYERPTPSRVGFYLWLETVKPVLGAERMETVLEYCADEITAFPKVGKPERLPDPPELAAKSKPIQHKKEHHNRPKQKEKHTEKQ